MMVIYTIMIISATFLPNDRYLKIFLFTYACSKNHMDDKKVKKNPNETIYKK